MISAIQIIQNIQMECINEEIHRPDLDSSPGRSLVALLGEAPGTSIQVQFSALATANGRPVCLGTARYASLDIQRPSPGRTEAYRGVPGRTEACRWRYLQNNG